MEQQQSKVERFLKLGYSHGDILRVLESLRHDAQTNDILEELIKTCQGSASASVTAGGWPGHRSPQLVPRGCSPPQPRQPSPQPDQSPGSGFRPVVIDGSNVAMSHGNKQVFSCRGVQLAVTWFWERGVRDITVFVPLWRKEQPRPEAPITDQHILNDLERRKILVFTPSRCVSGKRVVCYDDRYIVKLAYDSDGIIVSNDNYRDLQTEKPQWKKFIEERLLMYTFANDTFMPPDDPLGRNGPTIDNFLRKKPKTPENKQQHCPYGKKCTYGVKCKFYHPERSNQSQLSVADELRAKSKPAVDGEQAFPAASLAPSRGGSPGVPGYTTPYGDAGHAGHSSGGFASVLAPPPSQEDLLPHRVSPCELRKSPRESGSPARPHQRSLLPPCPSLESDRAYGSLEASLSQLYIRDPGASLAYSSGAPGSSLGSGDFFLSGTPSHERSLAPGYAPNAQQGGCREHLHAGSSRSHCQCTCGYHGHSPHSPYNGRLAGDDFAEEQYFQQPVPQYARSLDYSWGQGQQAGVDVTTRATDSVTDRRRDVRALLSTIFPQSAVDQVMSLYPHVLDMTELVAHIQKFRTSHISF